MRRRDLFGTPSNGELQARCDCLAMFVRRMLRVMTINNLGDREVCRQATVYLKAIGATGSVLRNKDIQEQCGANEPKDGETYVSIAQWGNCKICGQYKDLRYGCCFKCSDQVDGQKIPGGHEFWDSRNLSNRWKVYEQ